MTTDKSTPYDYSATEALLEPFQNPFGEEPFLDPDIATPYGELWQFKEAVQFWNYGVNKHKNYVFLRRRMQGSPLFQNWNLNEKVALVDVHHEEYVVIMLQNVDDQGKRLSHTHSIVFKVGSATGQFNMENFLDFLASTHLERCAEEFTTKFWPWNQSSTKTTARKIASMFITLDRYAMELVHPHPTGVSRRDRPRVEDNPQPQSESETVPRMSAGSRQGMVRSSQRKRKEPEVGPSEPTPTSNKKSSRRPTTAGSSGSGLTNVNTEGASAEPIPDYDKFAEDQKVFWETHNSCYLFEQRTFEVSIDKCIPARDEFIIRKLESSIVETVKKQLVMMADKRQRQKVCLTPVDANGELLRSPPKSWEEIKSGTFMIINGQHSIIASQQLQIAGCGATRRKELSKWEAVIVWSLDPNKLCRISEFYNTTNHLNHAQPTWGNNIISARNVWINLKRPCNVSNEAKTRGNGAKVNLSMYEVRWAGILHCQNYALIERKKYDSL